MKLRAFVLLFIFTCSALAQAAHTVHLTWTASVPDATHGVATGYKVFRGTVSGGPYTKLADVTTATYDDPTAIEGNTYFYVVSAVNSCCESAQSVPAQAIVNAPKPNTPGSVTCKIDLSTNPPAASCTFP